MKCPRLNLKLRLWMLMVGIAVIALALASSFWYASWRRHRAILAQLARPVDLTFFKNETPLQDLVGFIKSETTTPVLPDGVPARIDWETLEAGGKDRTSYSIAVRFFTPQEVRGLRGQPLLRSLELLLAPRGLVPVVRDVVLMITTPNQAGGRSPTQPAPVLHQGGHEISPRSPGAPPVHPRASGLPGTGDRPDSIPPGS